MEIRVHYDMNIDEVVEKYPIVSHILMRYGLGCSGCVISTAETIGEGIELHGLDSDIILEEINMILELEEEERLKEEERKKVGE